MNLQHHFLIAMPALQDPIFRRSVVYICEYNEDGAMGIIINKPLENLQVEGILDKLKIPAEARLPEIRLDKPVMLGGPLAEDRGFILHTPPVFSSSIRISDNTVVTTSRDVLETLGTANQPAGCARLRFLGKRAAGTRNSGQRLADGPCGYEYPV